MRSTITGILSALAYYDQFEFPLTAQEIFFALPESEGARPPFEEVEQALSETARLRAVETKDGLYFLPGREGLIGVRKSCYAVAEAKYKRVKRFLRIARHAPYLRAAFVCNTLARSNARAESDIDLYLVAAPGRVWSTRLCVTGLATLLRVRPTVTDSADRICLSFFVTTDALNIRPLAIEDDVYLAHWLQELYPVYDEAGIARRSYVENGWLRDVLPETRVQTASPRRFVAPRFLRVKRTLERALDAFFGDRLERWAKRKQLSWLPASLRAAAGTTDSVLKFHDRDRRAQIRDAYHQKRAYALRALA